MASHVRAGRYAGHTDGLDIEIRVERDAAGKLAGLSGDLYREQRLIVAFVARDPLSDRGDGDVRAEIRFIGLAPLHEDGTEEHVGLGDHLGVARRAHGDVLDAVVVEIDEGHRPAQGVATLAADEGEWRPEHVWLSS